MAKHTQETLTSFAGMTAVWAQRLAALDRMDKLMGILALAFAWCLIVGH